MSTLLERRGDLLDTRVPLLTRIKFPRVWKHHPGNITIEDLQEEKFDEALNHIKKFYFKDERVCSLSNISEDNESVENYLKLIKWWMQDTQSLIAVNEETGKIVGLLIERVLDLYLMKTMSRVMHYHGAALTKLQKFMIQMVKNLDVGKLYKTDEYNQIFIWSVEPRFRKNGIGKALLQACIEQTKSFKLTILMGIFTSSLAQTVARSEGFKPVHELQYNWKEKSQTLFEKIGTSDKSAKLMVLNLDSSDYCRNKCEEILQKYNITRLMKKKAVKDKDENKDKDVNHENSIL